MSVLGRGHPRVRELRALRRDRRLQEERGVLLAEGLHLADAALRAGAGIRLALVSPALDDALEGPELRARLREAGVEIVEVSAAALDSLQDARSPQPVLLVVRRPPGGVDDALAGRPGVPLVVVADGLQDPGNLGSILRTADAAGATGLVASDDGADLCHPRTVRATMGSIFRLPSARAPVDDALSRIRARAFTVVAGDPSAGVDYDRCDLTGPVAILVGREGSGLARARLEAADVRARIPMAEGVDSLSAAAAAAVLLYEAARQRRVTSSAGG